jgi:hypothetical protein
VNIRESLLENFAGDLEYHPRRGLVYLILAIGAACFWIFSPYEKKFEAIPLIFALGSLTVLVKGAFLFRRSSEGLGLSDQQLADLSGDASLKTFPSVPAQAAQVVQDFGTGAFLLWPLLNMAKDIDPSWSNPPRLQLFLTGAVLFFLGWMIRRFTSH